MVKMKKILSALISGMMMLSVVPSAVMADTGITVVTTDGKTAEVGNTLRAEVTNSVGNVTYQWWTSDGDIIASGQEFVPTYEQFGKSIYCEASDEAGNFWSSENIAIASDFDAYVNDTYASGNVVTLGLDPTGYGDASWNFEMTNPNGSTMSFSLLDIQNNAESKYYIMANDYYTARSNNGTNGEEIINKYDPSQAGSVAYNANLAYTAKDSNMWALPAAVVDAIDTDHVWITERVFGTGTTEVTEPYTFKAGVVVPAIWEMKHYIDRIDVDIRKSHQITTQVPAWLRTGYTNSVPSYFAISVGVDAGIGRDEVADDLIGQSPSTKNYLFRLTGLNATVSTATGYSRVEFFLNEDFFKNAKINLETAGANILSEIRQYGYDDLSKIYTDEEIATYIDASMVHQERLDITVKNDAELKIGSTLVAEVVNATGTYNYQWFADGAAIEGANTNELILTYAQWGKEVSCTATGASTISKAVGKITSSFDTYQNDALANLYVMYIGDKTGAGDSTWNFTVDGKSFTILDINDNDESTFFVIANDIYGGRKANSETSVWDPTVTDTVAQWMNDEIKTDGFSTLKLPSGIVDSINTNHVWITEKSFDGTVSAPYTFKAGIVAPSIWELREYFDKITLDVRSEAYVTGKNVYWFRTPYNANHYQTITTPGTGTALYALSSTGQNYIQTAGLHRTNSDGLIRPVFHLKKDFFTKTKLDLSTVGSNVIDTMKSMYSNAELLKVYSKTELAEAGFEIGFTADVSWLDGTNEISSLAGQSTIAAEISISSREANDATADVIVALYDGDNKLVKVESKTVSIPAKQTVLDTVSLTGLLGVTDEYSAKVFVWNSLEGMQTLIDNAIDFETGVEATTASVSTETRSQVFFQ